MRPPNKKLQLTIADGRPLRGLPLALAAEFRYVRRPRRMQPNASIRRKSESTGSSVATTHQLAQIAKLGRALDQKN
jgi:hypothetical protein